MSYLPDPTSATRVADAIAAERARCVAIIERAFLVAGDVWPFEATIGHILDRIRSDAPRS